MIYSDYSTVSVAPFSHSKPASSVVLSVASKVTFAPFFTTTFPFGFAAVTFSPAMIKSPVTCCAVVKV